jgi:hypothetical protein
MPTSCENSPKNELMGLKAMQSLPSDQIKSTPIRAEV